MKIKKISVNNFRNLKPQALEPGAGLNIFHGANGQGKTNILEAVYLCCIGKSARTSDEREMICFEKRSAKAEIEFEFRGGAAQVGVSLAANGAKKAELNGSAVRLGQLLGRLNCVYFSPEEIRMISATPQERRHFLDVGLCQVSPAYYQTLTRFNRILLQRNNLLRSFAGHGARGNGTADEVRANLEAWDAHLAKEGARLTLLRADFCAQIAPVASAAHERLCGGEPMETVYAGAALPPELSAESGRDENGVGGADGITGVIGGVAAERLRVAEEYYYGRLRAAAERDLVLGYTGFGAQRDDIKFSLSGTDLREFGSQGQQRSAALALVLAEAELFESVVGEPPVMLLDDVLSELDRKRQRALMGFCDKTQIFLTGTKVDAALLKGLNVTKFKVENGAAKKQ